MTLVNEKLLWWSTYLAVHVHILSARLYMCIMRAQNAHSHWPIRLGILDHRDCNSRSTGQPVSKTPETKRPFVHWSRRWPAAKGHRYCQNFRSIRFALVLSCQCYSSKGQWPDVVWEIVRHRYSCNFHRLRSTHQLLSAQIKSEKGKSIYWTLGDWQARVRQHTTRKLTQTWS